MTRSHRPISTSSMLLRRFRRLRVTIIFYTCGSLCAVLLLVNFNEDLKKLLHQKQTHYSSSLHEHDLDHEHEIMVESSLPSSRDLGDFGPSGSYKSAEENTNQSKVRRALNIVASGSLTQSPRESSAKPWFMWRGTRLPTLNLASHSKLWHEENPDGDRIVDQLMYLTNDPANIMPNSSLSSINANLYGFGMGLLGSVASAVASVGGITSRKSRDEFTAAGTTVNGMDHVTRNGSTSIVLTAQRKPLSLPSPGGMKTILLYYGLGMSWGAHITSGRHVFLQQKCPVNACRLTGNRAQMSKADVVVFKDLFMNPKVKRPPSQLWTMYMLECPLNTQNFVDKNVFNLTATYRHDSDIVTPYEKWVYYDDRIRALPQIVNYAAGKTRKVAWFVSNCVAKNSRLEFARELGKYIDVDIYGACGSHACSRANAKQCFELLSKTYKFYLAFENSNCRDYISEKFFVNGLGNNVLPIVMGAHPDDYKRVAPSMSYIHVDDFASPRELALFLLDLDKNDEEYNKYFQWKGTGEFVNTHFFCRLCAMIHYVEGSNHKPRFYEDFNKWWRGKNVCTRRSWRNQPDVFDLNYADRQTTNHQPQETSSTA